MMKSRHPFRLLAGTAFALLFAAATAFARGREPGPPPAVRPARVTQRAAAARAQSKTPAPIVRTQPNGAGRPIQNQQHLAQWMENHRNMSLPEQQRSLESEPGFHDLPAQVQQRYRDQLVRLYNMNPQQRSQMLDRNEQLERMSPPQRQQWRGAVEQWNAMPLPQRRLVGRAILDLREMPPEQRQQVLDSPAMRSQFSDGERSMIGTILTAEPYNPNRNP
jgi:hypothetical protein